MIDIGRQAGNKALAELLGHGPLASAPASAGVRVRDSLRATQVQAQREFGLVAQRDFKEEFKQPGRLLSRGSEGHDVKLLQQLLGVDADGIFGGVTQSKVLDFQRSAALASDGIVGPQTWQALVQAAGSTGKLPTEGGPTRPMGNTKWGDIELKRGTSPDKLAPDTTDKIAPESTEKLASESNEKIVPESTEKLPPDSTDKAATSEMWTWRK